jgi:hypothetical protein
MGRGRKARTTAANIVGATPATEEQPFAISIQQRQAAQDAVLVEDAAVRRKQPAKLKPTNFFTAPPRTEIFEERDDADGAKDLTFKKRAAAAAPANLGQISGSEYRCAPTHPPATQIYQWHGLQDFVCI